MNECEECGGTDLEREDDSGKLNVLFEAHWDTSFGEGPYEYFKVGTHRVSKPHFHAKVIKHAEHLVALYISMDPPEESLPTWRYSTRWSVSLWNTLAQREPPRSGLSLLQSSSDRGMSMAKTDYAELELRTLAQLLEKSPELLNDPGINPWVDRALEAEAKLAAPPDIGAVAQHSDGSGRLVATINCRGGERFFKEGMIVEKINRDAGTVTLALPAQACMVMIDGLQTRHVPCEDEDDFEKIEAERDYWKNLFEESLASASNIEGVHPHCGKCGTLHESNGAAWDCCGEGQIRWATKSAVAEAPAAMKRQWYGGNEE